MRRATTFRHLLVFHTRTGGRVALRTLAPVAGGSVVAAVLGGSHMAVLGPVAGVAFPAERSFASAAATVLVLTSIAGALAPRLVSGTNGWSRHLPVSAVDQRRALTAGLVVAISPVLVLLLGAGVSSLWSSNPGAQVARLVGLPLLSWGAALAAVPIAWRWRLAAAFGGALAVMGAWWPIAASAALVGLADGAAGGVVDRRRSPPRRREVAPGGPGGLWLRIAARALGVRPLGAWAAGGAVLLPAWLLVVNNDLELARRLLVVRLATLVAASVVIAMAAEALVVRRPPWPWIRALPWSSRRRCALDAALLAGLATPVAALGLVVEVRAVPAVLAVLPWLALRAAAAVRGDRERSTGAAGQVLLEGGLTAGLVALVPWLALATLALAPAALRWAEEAERAQDVSRWHELHHLAAGDPMSWEER